MSKESFATSSSSSSSPSPSSSSSSSSSASAHHVEEASAPVTGLMHAGSEAPHSNYVNALLTDMYQVTMIYGYFKVGKHNDFAVFDVFFRKNPFSGEFTVFGGLGEVIRYLQTFHFAPAHIEYLRTILPTASEEFWAYLSSLDCSKLKVYSAAEGSIVFPREPIMRIEGPLGICQLLETTILNLVNFPSLIATNAARYRRVVGPSKTLIEFGLRRAQGPDGAMSATQYSYLGGFDGTSNLLGGLIHGIKTMGTHAHSYVSSFISLEDLHDRTLLGADMVSLALRFRAELGYAEASDGELAAYISYAQAFPDGLLALVDTYDTLKSGVPNFICVALALNSVGKKALGIRLDSGDLAYLSKEARRMMKIADEVYSTNIAKTCTIVASNDINETVLQSLTDQGHEIDTFGIGTNLVTCQAQPALGMVYKLVEINGVPRIKLSNDASKITLPCSKEVYRLIGQDGAPLLDLIIRVGESRPVPNREVLCRHPYYEDKRVYVKPTHVIPLLRLQWKGKDAKMDEGMLTVAATVGGPSASGGGKATSASATASEGVASSSNSSSSSSASSSASSFPPSKLEAKVNLCAVPTTLNEQRQFVMDQLEMIREDSLRPINPTPYKVSVSNELWLFTRDLKLREIPIPLLE